jgi:predicted enzyme related to lactoylglutathione lyase
MTTPSDLPPSILSHVSVGTNDLPRAKAFYDAVLATLHIGVVLGEPRCGGLWARLPGILSATAA